MALATHMRVSALLATYQARGAGAYVLHRGDETAGALIVKQAHLDGMASVYARRYGLDGEMVWERALGPDPVPEREADAYLDRRAEGDPDLWIVEVEQRDGEPDLSLL